MLSVRQCVLLAVLFLGLSEAASFVMRLIGATAMSRFAQLAYLRFLVGPALIGIVLQAAVKMAGCNIRNLLLPVRGSASTFVVAAIIGITTCLCLIATNAFLVSRWSIGSPRLFMLPRNSNEAVLVVGVVGVVAPVLEEALFRGVFLRAFVERFTTPKAIVFTVLLFVGAHLSIARMVPLLALGIVTSLVYTKTRSVHASIVAHAGWNLTMIVGSLF